ncbi:hypothetical protein [Tomitella cavernea]|uniref:Uncharacterized protein n=1 Tax=Tomitella cavernea TaxID=1387982 RepID=A0ABP9CH10_9ACTN|nr:hypothetical protein [Tomitella cavernea]
MASQVDRVNEFTAAFDGAIGSDVKDVREQLCGEGARDKGEYTGWPQLGGRTVVDAIAAIGAALGVPGMYDPHSEQQAGDKSA